MKGLMKKTAAAAAAAVLSVSAIYVASAFGGVTESPTPVDKNDTALYWATKGGAGWAAAPSTPLLHEDKLYFTTGQKLKVLDKYTGEYLDIEGDLAGDPGYNLVSPIYADGMIIVPLSGKLQAFDAETLESLWVYTDDIGGQSNSELTYSDGYVYTGYWRSETGDANFVCVPVADTDPNSSDEAQEAAWTYTSAGGFYWAGGYDNGDYIVVSTDNGLGDGSSEGSKLIAFDKNASIEAGTPVIASQVENLAGDLRSAVSYDEETGYYFVTSKAKLVYRFTVDENGVIGNVQSLELTGMSTSTPIAANGRLYVGVSGAGQFTEYSGSGIVVIDSEKFEIVYALSTNGYPQSSALISDRDGENYVYFTANYTPGKVYAFHDNKDMTEPEKTETVEVKGAEYEFCPTLFTPTGAQAQYCLASVVADEDGTLYFKNDSCYLMALGSRVDSLKVDGKTVYKEGDTIDYDSITVTAVLANGVEKDVTKYAGFAASGVLEAGDDELSVSYDGMLYGDTDDEIGHEYGAIYGKLSYTVLSESDYTALQDCIAAIDSIGTVTAQSGDAIANARALYDALSDDVKELVTNADTLVQAEKDYKAITDNSSEPDSSSESSSSESSSSESSSSGTSTSSETSTSSSGSSSSSAASVSSTASGTSSVSSSGSSSASSSSKASSSSVAETKNPVTGSAAAAVSAVLLLGGAVLMVSKKNK